jgi:hypothetical protein
MPAPFAPRHDVLSAVLDTPTLALQCVAAAVRSRPLWQLPVSLVVAVAQALWGSALVPATLLLGSAQVRPCSHSTAASRSKNAGCHYPPAALRAAVVCVEGWPGQSVALPIK